LHKYQPRVVCGMTQQTRLLERPGALQSGRHLARFLQGLHRVGDLADSVGGRLRWFRHSVRSHVGGFSSPASQPRAPDCIGSCDTLIA
jgi:hypothetical protein